MFDREYIRLMAAYTCWQNGSLYDAASELSDAARNEDRGAFFGSIHGTLNHLLWGDQLWLHRLAGTPSPISGEIPDSRTQYAEWSRLRDARPRWALIIQLFNHGTHHRGQVHAMLTAAGARPDDTDVPFMNSVDYPWPDRE